MGLPSPFLAQIQGGALWPTHRKCRCREERHSISFPQGPGSRPGSGGDRIGPCLLSLRVRTGPALSPPSWDQAPADPQCTLPTLQAGQAGGRGGAGARRQGGGAAARTPAGPLLLRAAVRPWPPREEALSSFHLWPPWCQAAGGGGGSRGGGQRPGHSALPGAPRARGTHVESGVLGAEEREGHGERPQPRAAVVLLGGDSVAVLRAERVEVGQGHRAAHPARPEPPGHGQEQRPGGTARHRQRSAAGTERDKAAQSWDGCGQSGDGAERSGGTAGTERGQRGTERGFAVPAAGSEAAVGSGPQGRAGVRAARPRRRQLCARHPRARPGRCPVAAPRRKAPGGTAFGAGPAPGAAI